ncbi:MAG: thymidine phosphorylase [Acidobacteria bacterium]|nr:thymidine phosphorylase [Acidobacteriota bacterium]MBI3264872.1 thymidine phosphorylase [Acidobacteriota bacterium]
MSPVDIIKKKRDGHVLDPDEIGWFVRGVTSGAIPDYQASALLMAIVVRGMNAEETAALTDAMVRSGIRADLSDIPGPKVDKHSTGGVGDKTSLILAPLAAACGAVVPMMSGRGLGHTGGTLDKLESIPGFRVGLAFDEFKAALKDVGCVLIGQTSEIAPADKKLYALRDVTGTVESLPLITASIMSKKIAEGIDGLVLDVTTGRGAFIKTEEDARTLAKGMVGIGQRCGVRTEAILTSMDAPRGRAVGNGLEVIECVETLKGRGPADLEQLSVLLAARLLVLAGISQSSQDAERRARAALTSGAGLEKLRHIIARQGGDAAIVDDYRRLPSAPNRRVIEATRDGVVARLDAELVGRASMTLGAGRERVEDSIDHAVGVLVEVRLGNRVNRGQPLVEAHYRSPDRLDRALALLADAVVIADDAPAPRPQVLETIGFG